MQGPHGVLGQGGSPGAITLPAMTAHWQQQLLKCEVCLSLPISLETCSFFAPSKLVLNLFGFGAAVPIVSPLFPPFLFNLTGDSNLNVLMRILSDEPCLQVAPPSSKSKRHGRAYSAEGRDPNSEPQCD